MKEKNKYDRSGSTRICIRFEDELLADIDKDIAEQSKFKNRSQLIKEAVKLMLYIRKE